MHLTPYDITKINYRGGYKRSNNLSLLEEFANSDLNCVKIENFTQKTAVGCYTSFFKSIRRYNMTGIHVIIRGEEVFLVKDIKH